MKSVVKHWPPVLSRSDLTGHVYIVTSYRQTGDKVEAIIKYDVTDQFAALAADTSKWEYTEKTEAKAG